MKINLSWTVVALAVAFTAVESAQEMGPKTKLPDDKLFSDPSAFCEGCYGLVHEIHKLLSRWTSEKGSMEDHIDSAMVAVCNTDRLRAYVLSPPKMLRLCSGILAHYEEELGLALLMNYGKKNPKVDKVFDRVCRKAIPACPKNMKPMSVARKEQREKDEAERAAKKEEQTGTDNKEENLKEDHVKKSAKNEDKKVKKQKSKTKQKSSEKHKKDEL